MTKLSSIAIAVALACAPACGKKDKDNKNKNPPQPVVKTNPNPETPKEAPKPTSEDVARRFQDCWGFFSAKDWDKFGSCYAENAEVEMVDNSDNPGYKGRAAAVEGAKGWATSFPDIKGTPQLVVVSGTKVFAIVHVTGTNTAPLKLPTGEKPATNKKYGMLIGQTVELNDKLEAVKESEFMDFATFANQLGLMPGKMRAATDKGWTDTAEVVIAKDDEAAKTAVDNYNKAIESWNKHDMKAMTDMVADDYVGYVAVEPADDTGKAGMEKGLGGFWKAFSDVKMTPQWVVGAGDYVIARNTAEGTNDGSMGPMPKTGNHVKIDIFQVLKLTNGKVSKEWVFFNGGSMMEQMMKKPSK